MSTTFDYKRYLASREWATKREAVRQRSHNTCERCEILPQCAVHHLTYERIGHELIEDLQAICEPCHLYESGKIPVDPVDVLEWASNSAYSDSKPPPWNERLAPGWRLESMWEDRYGGEWEFMFIAFLLSWPAGSNITPMRDWPALAL